MSQERFDMIIAKFKEACKLRIISHFSLTNRVVDPVTYIPSRGIRVGLDLEELTDYAASNGEKAALDALIERFAAKVTELGYAQLVGKIDDEHIKMASMLPRN